MDPETLRADVPALEQCTYFNTGASGPSPRRVVDAATAFLERHAFGAPCAEGPYPVAFDAIEAARETVAAHLGADPEEVAFTNSTADAIGRVAGAIDWQPGDVVVRTDLEHPAGRLPWDRLADVADVEVRVLETQGGRLVADDLSEAIADARLVVLSSLTWTHGTRLPVASVVEAAHDAGGKVLVDAVQSVGQHPVDVREWGADFVAGAGHKWLLGVWGGGFLYVADDAVESLDPRRIGYRGVEDPSADGYEYAAGARRLEIGTRSPAPIVALATAIETMEAVGPSTVEDRIDRLSTRLAEGLGDRLVSPADARSGLVTFAAEDPERTVEGLAERGIVVRALPSPNAVRASVHAINTDAEVDRLLSALDELAG